MVEWPQHVGGAVVRAAETLSDRHYLAALWEDYMPAPLTALVKFLVVLGVLAATLLGPGVMLRDMYRIGGKVKTV